MRLPRHLAPRREAFCVAGTRGLGACSFHELPAQGRKVFVVREAAVDPCARVASSRRVVEAARSTS